MTNQTNWTEYTGSDEQIAELINPEISFIVDNPMSIFGQTGCVNSFYHSDNLNSDSEWLKKHFADYGIKRYWLIPDDPLREMKVRQAMTKQPTWIRDSMGTYCTTTPDWNIPNAEYAFTEFKD